MNRRSVGGVDLKRSPRSDSGRASPARPSGFRQVACYRWRGPAIESPAMSGVQCDRVGFLEKGTRQNAIWRGSMRRALP